MTSCILLLFYAALYSVECLILNDQAAPNYAEVRHVLEQYRRKIARKYGRFNDIEFDPIAVSKTVQDDGTEATSNRKVGVATELFENDILLTLPQAEALLSETNKRTNRQAQVDERYFWEKRNISYVFIGNEETWMHLIRTALGHIEAATCFRFIENGNDKDYIAYYRGSGCWSSVGRVGGKQHISIGYGCDNEGIIAHETLHALGLWHEQSRSDRDEVIKIRYHNIIKNLEYNFEKRTLTNSDNLGQPYDLGSVMHYGPTAFTSGINRYTIVAKDESYQHTMGQRAGLSFKDAKMINTRYCSDICAKDLSCMHGGYPDPNNCEKCRCPPGFGGEVCNDVEPSRTEGCGGELVAKTEYQSLENIPMASNLHCVWRITSSLSHVEVVLDKIDMTCGITCESYLELKYKSDFVPTGPRFCCPPSGDKYVSDGKNFILIFETNPNNDNRFTGFKLRYRASNGATNLTVMNAKTGTISTTQAMTESVNLEESQTVSVASLHSTAWSTSAPISETTEIEIFTPKTEQQTTLSMITEFTSKNEQETASSTLRILETSTASERSTIDLSKTTEETSGITTNLTLFSTEASNTTAAKATETTTMESTIATKEQDLKETTMATANTKEIEETQTTEVTKSNEANSTVENMESTAASFVATTELTTAEESFESTNEFDETTTRFSSVQPFPDSYWSEWGAWSQCSVSCGGCGLRLRVRACYGRVQRCEGEFIERRECGFERCPVSDETTKCHGRLVIPCDLMEQLEFNIIDGSSIKFLSLMQVPRLNLDGKNLEILKSLKRQRASRNVKVQTTDLCERHFVFACPSYSVSINIDWRSSDMGDSPLQYDTRGCCYGYFFNGKICTKN